MNFPHHCDHDNIPPQRIEIQRMLFIERNGVWIYWTNHMEFIDSIPELDLSESKFLH